MYSSYHCLLLEVIIMGIFNKLTYLRDRSFSLHVVVSKLVTCISCIFNHLLKLVIFGHKVSFTVELDQGSVRLVKLDSYQALQSCATGQLGSFGPAHGLGLLIQPCFSLKVEISL